MRGSLASAIATLGTAFVGVLAAACTTHVPLDRDHRSAASLPAASVVELLTSDERVVGDESASRDRSGFVVRSLSIGSLADETQDIEFEYYDVDGDERRPVIVLLPIYNGALAIPRFFARYFANQGWAAVVVLRGHDPLTALLDPETTAQRSLADYRRVLDWVEGVPELDSDRVGVFGVSLGAMDAVVLAAFDQRIDSLVVAMAGGDVPYLVRSTNYRRVVRGVEQLAEREGTSVEELMARVDAEIKTDPINVARYIDPERVLMIVTRTDAIIPFEAQQRLRASLGSPETLYLATGHRPSVLLFPKVRSAAFEFFARQFGFET